MGFLSEFISVLSLSLSNNSSWVYFADWILAFMVALAFVFYFNRLVGFVLSCSLQMLLWKHYRVDVSVEAVRVLFLGGRIFAKNLVVITEDYTISILNLNLTWRYWILQLTRLPDYYLTLGEEVENGKLPSRFTLLLEGLEVFYYNRTVAYDHMSEFLSKETDEELRKQSRSVNIPQNMFEKGLENDGVRRRNMSSTSDKSSYSSSHGTGETIIEGDITMDHSSKESPPPPASATASSESSSSELYFKFLLKILPLSIRIKKGTLVLGNATTPTILVASCRSADSLIDISKAPNELDKYRQLHNFQFHNLSVSMKPNVSYDRLKVHSSSYHPQPEQQLPLKRKMSTANLKRRRKYKTWYKFEKSVGVLFDRLAIWRGGPRHNETNDVSYKNWRGLQRYVGDSPMKITHTDAYIHFAGGVEDEYARYSSILDSPATRINYYYDLPGIVPETGTPTQLNTQPPGFGVDIELSMATIHYGPWADKQRIPLQTMFFPTLYRDSEPSAAPGPGELRVYKGFDVMLEVKDELRFRVPTREPSKDHTVYLNKGEDPKKNDSKSNKKRRKKTNDANNNQTTTNPYDNNNDLNVDDETSTVHGIRPFGWLELKMYAGSSILSHTSFIASELHGWPNCLDVNFMNPEVRSSVNHDILFTADFHNMNCNVGFPLKWNGKCNWEFKNKSKNANIYFLREHAMLLSDIFTDFGAGPGTPYELFRPFHYQFNWSVDGYKLYLNVNDANIIDNPLDFNNNKYFSFQGDHLKLAASIPMNGTFSKSNTIKFSFQTSFFKLILDTPEWHTTNAFMEQTKDVGRANNFSIDGSYTYFDSVEINTSNFIVIKCLGDYVTLQCYGFVVRYLLTIRENYFGDNIHFQTFEEYSNKTAQDDEDFSYNGASTLSDTDSSNTVGSDYSYWRVAKIENDVDVLFQFLVRQGLAILPYNIYDSTSHIALRFDSLDVDLRFTNYYMDLQADITPITAVFVKEPQGESIMYDIPAYTKKYLTKPELTIDGLAIHGHRMFGLPPVEPTYYCKWDISAGEILFDTDGSFLSSLGSCVGKVGLGYKDLENELIIHIPTLYDVTHFCFSCPLLQFLLKCQPELEDSMVLKLDIESVLLTFNDLANDRYSSKLTLKIPMIRAYMLEGQKIMAYAQTSINVNNFCQKESFLDHRRLQQEHIRKNDAPFHRCPFLLYETERDRTYNEAYGCFITSLSLPDVPYPLNKDTRNIDLPFDSEYTDLDGEVSECSSRLDWSLDFDEDFKMKPLTDYDPVDFCPDYEVDPKYEYDNFIVELDAVQSFVSPQALYPLAKLLQSFHDSDLNSLMDTLHLDLLEKLMELLDPKSTVKNLRLVLQECNIKIGEFAISDPKEVFEASPRVPCVNVIISEPSVALSVKRTNDRVNNDLVSSESLSAAFHIKEVLVSISNPNDFVLASSFNLGNIEFWFTKSEDCAAVCSTSIDKTELSISDSLLEWLTEYILHLYRELKPSFPEFKKIKDIQQRNIAELVYQVSTGGKEYHIDHDPSVLTKPAYVLRPSKDHIRFHDSWKLLTRLRHVLNNLPTTWSEELHESLMNYKWAAPASAYNDVLSIFSHWRAWEVGDISRSYFFKHIFPLNDVEIPRDNLNLDGRVDLGNISFRIMGENNALDFIELQGLSVAIGALDIKQADLSYLGHGVVPLLQSIECVLNVFAYKSKVSTITFDMIPRLMKLIDGGKKESTEELTEPNVLLEDGAKSGSCLEFNLVVGVGNFQQQLLLPYSSLDLRAHSVVITSKISILSDFHGVPFSFSSQTEESSLDFWGENQIMANSIEQFNMLVANCGTLEDGVKVSRIGAKRISMLMTEEDLCLVDVLKCIMDQDVPYLEALLADTESTEEDTLDIPTPSTSTSAEEYLLKKLGEASLDVLIDEIVWAIDLLYPLGLKGSLYSTKFSVNLVDEAMFLNSVIQKIDFQLGILRRSVVRIENSQIRTTVKFTETSTLLLAAANMNMGFTKITIPQIFQALQLCLVNTTVIETRINNLTALLPQNTKPLKDVSTKTPNKPSKSFAFKCNYNNDYIGVSTFFEKTKLSFELEGFSLGTYNVAHLDSTDSKSAYIVVPIFGEVSIPTARLSVLDRSIPVGLSSIIDVSVTLKVLNSKKETDKLQSLQIESQYCRICLSPPALFRIVSFVDQLVAVMDEVTSKLPEKKVTKTKSDQPSHPISLYFSSITILSYNFCIGWLFADSTKEYPGIIIGAERFFAVVEETVGKFTLMEAYLSVANGVRSSNYYNTLSEKLNLNRAYMPLMQITYLIERTEGSRNLKVQISGDKLDVKFLSDSIILIEKAVKSGTLIQVHFDKRVRRQATPKVVKDTSPQEEVDTAESPLLTFFSSIELLYTFAGSNILLYRLNDGEVSTSTPSLYLHSPAIKIATMYRHQKDAERKHTVKCQILTSPFDNTLYASCVPVILDIVDGVKRMMRNDKPDTNVSDVAMVNTGGTPSSEFDFSDLLKDVDLHFGIRVEQQKLSLSCEPTAKVEAVVSVGGISFQVNSLTDDVTSLVSILQFDSLNSTLQHVYSREISGSVDVKNILLVSKIDFGEVTKVVSTGSVSNVTSYVNVKQFQDLNLFKDIWVPKEYFEETESVYEEVLAIDEDHISSTKNLSSRFKEVSTTYAVPWELTCMILDVALQVDFGQSLGNVSLTSNKIWAISHKTTDWAQDLKIGVDNVSLVLKGRLGGSFDIKNIFLHTSISWNDGENVLDVPLILLAGSVEALQLKASFDYHVFALASLNGYSIEIFNQKDGMSISKDQLFIATRFDSAEIYITSLAASNVMDIYNAIYRMVQENKNSYRETLRDSSRGKSIAGASRTKSNTGGNVTKKLVSKIEVTAGYFMIHVYPSSFDDSKVLVVKLDESKINFTESEFQEGVSNELEVQFNGLKVSLSVTAPSLEDFVMDLSVDTFVDHAHQARGGTIFVFPSFKISMKTFQKYQSNVIQYYYQSTFGGAVGIKWNLGSITFIREMYAIHSKALASRQGFKKGVVDETDESIVRSEEARRKEGDMESGNFDETINATIDKVSGDSKYVYQALAKPIIEAPQLKDLGNATPPLEWFGLHREKFPDLTHQLGITSLQKFISEVETQYTKVLGKA